MYYVSDSVRVEPLDMKNALFCGNQTLILSSHVIVHMTCFLHGIVDEAILGHFLLRFKQEINANLLSYRLFQASEEIHKRVTNMTNLH